MKHTKKVITGLLALSLTMGFAACTSDDAGGDNANAADVTTTTKATVEKNTETLKEEEQEKVEGIMGQLVDEELENKEIKWLAHYPKNPGDDGKSKTLSLEMFEQKYGAHIKDYDTTFDKRWDDLAKYIEGGEGIDFFDGGDVSCWPTGVVNGMFQPVDQYVDMNSAIWQYTKSAMEVFNFGGMHFSLVVGTSAEAVCLYSKQTIADNGFDDPYELYQKGEWNWDTFKSMLEQFVDEDNERYGLDDWFYEKALYTSAGATAVKMIDGHLQSNLDDPIIEQAMNFGSDLRKGNLVRDMDALGWSIHPECMGAGQELFQLCGAWEIMQAPEIWPCQIDPADLGIVPVPSPKGSKPYCGSTISGYAICKDAANPIGVVRFAECEIVAAQDPDAVAISDRKMMDDCGWTQEIIDRINECNDLARQYPVYDMASGVSKKVGNKLTNDGQTGMRAPFHTDKDWATIKAEAKDMVDIEIQTVDADLQVVLSELKG